MLNSRSNASLNRAIKRRNDEFYTFIEDIEKEVSVFRDQFKGKVVFCNADFPGHNLIKDREGFHESAFWEYFVKNFHSLKLKGLVSTYYNSNGHSHKVSYDGYNFKVEKLSGDGSFESEEVIDILDEIDIVCTNPPFSLFRKFIDVLVDNDKDFLIIGHLLSSTYKNVFPFFRDGYIKTGYSFPTKFKTPDKGVKAVSTIWLTTLNLPIEKRFLDLEATYYGNEDKYDFYDNYDALNVDRIKAIPRDYKGVMGVPFTIFKHHNPNQFRIIGYTSPSNGRVNGREKFKRVFILNKEFEK